MRIGPSAHAGVASLAAALALSSCGDPTPAEVEARDQPLETRVPAPLAGAYCDIVVEGLGTVATEDDYVPHVVMCENGGANVEALKAQAIAARSVAYYAMATTGSICDSQGCQVYGCGTTPSADVYAAVDATRGMYLSYSEVLTYGFYVAGDPNAAGPGCVGDLSAATEQWVTYNDGQTGTSVEQTQLGFVHQPGDPGYGQNRGCMSQWGARCLENDNGADYLEILRFYYGADVELLFAAGACTGTGDGDGDSGTTAGDSGSAEDGSSGNESVGDGDGDGDATGESGGSSESGGSGDPTTGTGDDSGSSDDAADEGGTGGPHTSEPGDCQCSSGPSPRGAEPVTPLGVWIMWSLRRRSRCRRSAQG
jgi:hypothetical protein